MEPLLKLSGPHGGETEMIKTAGLMQEEHPLQRNGGVKSPGPKARVREVLIVDDEEPLLLSIDDGLSVYRNYFTLLTATNGMDAVKLLKAKSSIDLVITDLSMPKMDGFELLTYVKRNFPRIPVILMTAYGTPKIENIVKTLGLSGYLEKPLDINVFADNIFSALHLERL